MLVLLKEKENFVEALCPKSRLAFVDTYVT